jgi:prepilin-type N-terminal cleavage/methylation domain-containing protein
MRRYRPSALRGFTLLELLIAIAVMSIAIMVFVSFYSSAETMNRTAVERAAAVHIAEDQLQAIIRNPANFVWQIPEQPAEELFPILQTEEDPPLGKPVALPAAMPVERTAYQRQANFHSKYRWQAFGRLPEPDAAYYEVTVLVHWKLGGRNESVALSASVPRFRVGGQA